MKDFKYILLSLILFPLAGMISSCSEEDNTEEEYANWQERNEGTTDRWAVLANNGTYDKYLTYSKNESTSGLKNSDYIYVEVVERGNGMECPIYTDNVRLAYRGRLIPSKSYKEGYVFDQSFLNSFDWKTAGMVVLSPNAVVEGFATALMNMHEGDRWIVHVPYQLGYGTTAMNSIPAYSDLTFEIAVKSFWHADEQE
jgi:FKBP-type peptidyl-prolyl cis-trans isomerase FklB